MLQSAGRSDGSFTGEKPRRLVLKGSGMEQTDRGWVGESFRQTGRPQEDAESRTSRQPAGDGWSAQGEGRTLKAARATRGAAER